jgi:hypothetical protein
MREQLKAKIELKLFLGSVVCISGLLLVQPSHSADAQAATQNAVAVRPTLAPMVAPANLRLPAPEAMVILIRSSVVALGQANITNNYTVLHSLGSSTFKANNTPTSLSSVFGSFRVNNIDLSPVVYLNPQLTADPTIANGRMHLVGNFPSRPMQVDFDLAFEPDNGIWKLFGLSVKLSPSQAAMNSSPIQAAK